MRIKKKVVGDFAYTSIALLILNVVLQIVIYPLINSIFGPGVLGDIVYLTGIIYTICASAGGAISNQKLLVRAKYEHSNSDFNAIVGISSIIFMIILFIVSLLSEQNMLSSALFSIVGCLVFLRYYAEVEFRINQNFRGYLIYYVIISVGYIIGFFLYLLTGYWHCIFLIGEGFAVIYIFLNGNIFSKEPISGHTKSIVISVVILVGSYLLGAFAVHYYKIFLRLFIDSNAVTVYYVSSFFGKSLDLVITPITTLLLSYLTVSNSKKVNFTSKKSIMIIISAGILIYIGFVVATPIYSYLFYNDLFNDVCNINFIVNIAQTISVVSSILIVLVLVEFGAKIHLIVQVSYVISYIICSTFFTLFFGVMGFAIGASIGFSVKLLVILFVGVKSKMKRA